ncbi:lecithin retinol acyltransferase family protein [Pseudomonas lalucatii]|uniref:Lecithin retinol acyltransferase family protein n=1 Tax=Pseudomonas lalucatii TaxID=1424203 RepID=A0ABS5PXY8_9PSED|nr:lecithin retinol acyltransferase family protein [Pseudomonas lalucatii]MBS7661063.1 lecithin retinol acyltransferase family protein [Pseudomonas lalucatii]MBS7724300.1 lecithin retinol acyltransferase family protein [Pseudomonas lalucatii]QVM87709.1 lecithin retinol acyltransferase family protein [Pseudomonas lalucatii]
MNSTHPQPQKNAPQAVLHARWDCNGGAEPPLGAHLITSRTGYFHHGIYVGNRRVVHYAGLSGSLHAGPVEEVSLTQFAADNPVWIRYRAAPRFDGKEAVGRARSRIGECRYRLLTNNCEHFCNWCRYGEHRSDQVRSYLVHPLAALNMGLRLLSRLLARGDSGRLVA